MTMSQPMPGPGKTIRLTAVVLSPLCWQPWKWVTCTQTIWHKRQKPCLQQQLLFLHSSNSFHQTSDDIVMVSTLVDKEECEKDAFALAAANRMQMFEHLMKISYSYCDSCDKGKRMSLVENKFVAIKMIACARSQYSSLNAITKMAAS